MAEHSKHNSDKDLDNGVSQSRRGQDINRSTEQSLTMSSKIHSTKAKDVLFFILCFALTASATLISSNFLTRGRQYFVPDAVMHILISILSCSGIICLVIMIIFNASEGRNRFKPQTDDYKGKRHAFGTTEKIVVLYIFALGSLCHILLRIVKISDCIQRGDKEEMFALVMYFSLALFSVVQLLFFRKYNEKRCTSLRSQIPIIFVVCANVSVCFSVLIQETVDVLDELGSNDNQEQKLNSSGKFSDHTRCHNSSLVRDIEPVSNFLYPLAIEFSLLAIEFVWFIWAIPIPHNECVKFADISHQIYSSTNSEHTPLLNGTRDSICRKMSKCGCSLMISLIFCGSTVIVTFITYFKENIHLLHSTFVVMELIFSALLFSSCGFGLLLAVSEEDHTNKDTSILGNSLCFFLTVGSVSVYHMFSVISSITLICNDAKTASSSLIYLPLFTEIFHLLAAYLQALFLGQCSRRTFYKFGQREQFILRMCVFVAIANGSMWTENSFLPFRKVNNNHLVNVTDSEFYGVTGWVLMSKILYPFCIYFRLESFLRCLEIIKRI